MKGRIVSRKKIRKKRKEITEEMDNGKREVGNRKHEREDCSENGRRETEEDRRTNEQRNVKKREQTSKETEEQTSRKTEKRRENMRNGNEGSVVLKLQVRRGQSGHLRENLTILLII